MCWVKNYIWEYKYYTLHHLSWLYTYRNSAQLCVCLNDADWSKRVELGFIAHVGDSLYLISSLRRFPQCNTYQVAIVIVYDSVCGTCDGCFREVQNDGH